MTEIPVSPITPLACSKIIDLASKFSDSCSIMPLIISIATWGYVMSTQKTRFVLEVLDVQIESVVMCHHLMLLNAATNFPSVLSCIGKRQTTKWTKNKVCVHLIHLSRRVALWHRQRKELNPNPMQTISVKI